MKFEYEVPELEIVKFTVLNSVLVASPTEPTYTEGSIGGGGDTMPTGVPEPWS